MSVSTREGEGRDVPTRRGIAGAIRLYWLFGGITVLWVLALVIAGSDRPRPWLDAGYWGVVASIALARFVDVTWLGGTTAQGVPATMVDWRRHAIVLTGGAFGGWGVAHALAEWLG